MRGLQRRLDQLERDQPQGVKPWLMVETGDDQTYTDPASGQRYSLADLDRLEAEGWPLIIVHYEQAQAAQA